MLSLLKIKNLAIVKQLEVEFSYGLNIITGETGAGKSIILKAISLLGGMRQSSDIIRSSESRCEVEGLFLVTPENRDLIIGTTDELCELIPDNEIIVKRIIEDNKGKIYINGGLITLTTLQKISPFLFDITGQLQQQSLLDNTQHKKLLDNYGGFTALLKAVHNAYYEFSQARKLLHDFRKENSEKAEYFRRLAFERDELNSAALETGERERLEADISKLANIEVIGNTINESLELLEDDKGLQTGITRLRWLLEGANKKDCHLNEVYKLTDSAYQQVGDIAFTLRHYLNDLEADPNRLESLRERLAEIARLERKYRKTVPEITQYYKKIQAELSEFEAGEFDVEKLEKKFNLTQNKLNQLEQELSKARKAKASELEKLVEAELMRLNMKKARFRIDFQQIESTSSGCDKIEFMLAANPGEPLRPLGKVASGGELSRILLTLKTILNEKNSTALQVFDEVDTGISGAVAAVVGEKLKAISKLTQVLLVTHSPQIAALADEHFVIMKESGNKETKVNITRLDYNTRVEELARMLAGKNVTDKFRETAKELLSV